MPPDKEETQIVRDLVKSRPRQGSSAALQRLVNTFKRNNQSDSSASRNKEEVSVCPQTFKDALDNFTESAKVAIDILSQIAETHPFIKGPVIAFKLVITLDLKRRENDAKVQAVNVEMQSMMTALVQLRNIEDPYTFEADVGLKGLMKEIENAIKDAASLCDWYMKKSMMRKYLKSVVYEARLVECIRRFVEFEARLQRALSIYTVFGIDTTNRTLEQYSAQLDDIQQQMRDLFLLLDSPREREVRMLIQSTGGARACIMDDKVLQLLVDKSGEFPNNVSDRGAQSLQKLRKSLLGELSEDVDKALLQNLLLFQGKLDIQLREIDLSITRQGDRIIAFMSGGHERIVDKHIREIWKEMGWKTTVKSRNFVLAVRDYYLGGMHLPQHAAKQPFVHTDQWLLQLPSPPSSFDSTAAEPGTFLKQNDDEEAWAVQYVNVTYLQAIAEAIDDDGSGFINIREVNAFTTMRPEGWSVLQWLAYWAAGWQSSISEYSEKIYRLLKKLYNLRNEVRQDNLILLDDYLDDTSFHHLELLLRSTDTTAISTRPELAKLRDEFCKAEEIRLEKNLEDVLYHLDSVDAVTLVTGPGRIERYIYPLIFLLLKRHLKIVQLARLHTLHLDEFVDKCMSLRYIFDVFDSRRYELSAIFKQMHIDPETHLKNYAFGMFGTSNGDPSVVDNSLSVVWNDLPYEPGEDDDVAALSHETPLDILKFGVQNVLELPASSLDTEIVNPDCQSNTIYGVWAGYLRRANHPSIHEGTTRIFISEVQNTDGTMPGTGETYFGSFKITYVVTKGERERQSVDLLLLYDDGYWVRCTGIFDATSASITGNWHSCQATGEYLYPPTKLGQELESQEYDSETGNRERGTFHFSRTPAPLVRFRYRPEAFAENPAKARWDFACAAILYTIRRGHLDRRYTMSRLRDSRRFIELRIKSDLNNGEREIDQLSDAEDEELRELEYRICPSVDRFYYSIAKYLRERLPYHPTWECDGPFCANAIHRSIIQSHFMCIVCINPSFTDTLDFCTDCKETSSTLRYSSHNTSHSLLRSHRLIHNYDRVRLITKSRQISERLKRTFQTRESPASNVQEGEIISCAVCRKEITLPCWACVECETDRVVCSDCDTKHQSLPPPDKMIVLSPGRIQDMHAMHAMVWVRDSREVDIPHHDQLTRVEGRLNAVEDLIKERLVKKQQMETASGETYEQRLSSIESRFDSLEQLLRDFISSSRNM